MSSFQASLFKLLDTAAFIDIDGYRVEHIDDFPDDVMRCECDYDNEWYFKDQEVEVCAGIAQGVVQLEIIDARDDEPHAPLPLVMVEFHVTRPIGPEDLED